jgi:hypothetical protein
MGQREEISTQLRNQGIPFSGFFRTPLDMIEVEIRERRDVGGPIDALHINNSGVNWIQRKQQCQE